MREFCFTAENEGQTDRLGAALADVLPDAAVVALCGTLGAGKTRLTRALAEACGVDAADVLSPTFVLCHEYRGHRAIYHMDAYRIQDDDEFLELGAEEYFEAGGITIVEWADRVNRCLPDERLEVHISVTGKQTRQFQFTALGSKYQLALDTLRSKVGNWQ